MNPFAWWKLRFGAYAPIGLVLRSQLENNWIRIHSLPDSKRYASNKIEYQVLLDRHNALADYLFRMEERCVLFKSQMIAPKDTIELRPFELDMINFSTDHEALAQFPGEISSDEDDWYEVRYAFLEWKPDIFDKIVLSVADEKICNLSLVSLSTGNIYAPYDGGADAFAFDKSISETRSRFSEWLSGPC